MELTVSVDAKATFCSVVWSTVGITVPMVGALFTVIFAVLGALVPQALVAVTEIARVPVVVPASVTVRVVPSLPSWVMLPGTVQL